MKYLILCLLLFPCCGIACNVDKYLDKLDAESSRLISMGVADLYGIALMNNDLNKYGMAHEENLLINDDELTAHSKAWYCAAIQLSLQNLKMAELKYLILTSVKM